MQPAGDGAARIWPWRDAKLIMAAYVQVRPLQTARQPRMRFHNDTSETMNSAPLLSDIHEIRDEAVMLDRDLALLYGVETKRFNEQFRRNRQRFPADFGFQLTAEEFTSLRSQLATLKPAGRGQHRKYLPWVFTEHGALWPRSTGSRPRR